MNYKNIFLSILLVPLTAMASDTDVTIRLQKLKTDYFERLLKLSQMSDTIIQKQNAIDDMMQRICPIAAKLDKHELEKFQDEYRKFGARLDKALSENNIKGFISYEFFEDVNNNDDLVIVKSLFIKYGIEKALLKELVKQYEEYMQELLDLDAEIEKLQR
jgi:hypothetical protein